MEPSERRKRSGAHKPREVKRRGWRDVSDAFWKVARQYIPPAPPMTAKGGRPPAEPRRLLNGMLYVLRTGCQWKMIPKDYYGRQHHAPVFPSLGRGKACQQIRIQPSTRNAS